ncbi:AAA family ATPase [Candidatus Thorarchaeota archaeon]|nr:MAG: AAA family ATPase [Candidatus Thorarchaeota archaeon]
MEKLAEEKSFAEAVRLTEPEQLPEHYVSQYSVERLAVEYQSVLDSFTSAREKMKQVGAKFGGRVLLLGPPGTDFSAFVHHLCREVPIKLISFRLEEVLNENKNPTDALVVGFEFARRSSPAVMYLERLDVLGPAASARSAVLREEIRRTTWDENEVLVVATSTKPTGTDPEVLVQFDRTYVIETASREDRVRVFESILKPKEGFETSLLAELTDGWGFESVKRLAVNLLMTDPKDTSRESLEQVVEQSGVVPLGNPVTLRRVAGSIEGGISARLPKTESDYPDEFLDQLYLMSVGEDYARTQKVIEVLNDGLPLSSDDREFLGRHPHLLVGTPEDRLTRLLRAKKTSDRLQRIMGR